MGGIAVVTDSLANIPAELVEKYDIGVIPVLVIFGHETYRDGIDMTPKEFYCRLRESEELPTTAVPSMGEFVKLYHRVGQEAEGIVSIHISSKLSATVEVAEAASRTLPEIPIHVVDSYTGAMAQGFIVLEAARAAAEGAGLEEVAERAREMVPKVDLLATLDTLEYLHRGGRVPAVAALVGSLLRIKPILYIAEDGAADVLEKPRTRAKAVRRILEITEERVGANPVHMAVIHADVPEEAEELKEEVDSRFNCVELYVTDFTPVIGTHSGPGVLGLTFWAEEGGG